MTSMHARPQGATREGILWWYRQFARVTARLRHQPTVCGDVTRCDCGWYTHGRPAVRARRFRAHLKRVGAA